MARYFFHLLDGQFVADAIGEEFATPAEAMRAAVDKSASAIADRQAEFWAGHGFPLMVTDFEGVEQFELNVAGRVPT